MSNRTARRAAAKQGKVIPKEKVYTLTESQIANMLAKERRKAYEEASKIAGQKSVDIAWQLMLAIPCGYYLVMTIGLRQQRRDCQSLLMTA